MKSDLGKLGERNETKAAVGLRLPPDGTKTYEIIDNITKQQPQPN